MSKNKRAVVVTTENRGVFFGYIENDKKLPSEVTLSKARVCVYWSADVKGFIGLAANGPTKSCKISFPAPKMTAYKVTSILDCSPEAIKQWETDIWS